MIVWRWQIASPSGDCLNVHYLSNGAHLYFETKSRTDRSLLLTCSGIFWASASLWGFFRTASWENGEDFLWIFRFTYRTFEASAILTHLLQNFKLMIALFASVFVNGHSDRPPRLLRASAFAMTSIFYVTLNEVKGLACIFTRFFAMPRMTEKVISFL